MNTQQLSELITATQQPNTQVVAQATQQLKVVLQDVSSIDLLMEIINVHADPIQRQSACIFLRKNIAKLWANIEATKQTQIKQVLLEKYATDTVEIVQHAIANVIGSLASLLIPNKQWNELFQYIFTGSNQEDLKSKELAMYLLSVIIEYFTHDEIKEYYANLNPIIESYLKSDQPTLKKISIVTVNKLSLTPKAVSVLSKYNNLIPLVLNALDLNDEDLIHKVFETFNEFIDYKKVIKPHLEMIMEAALNIVKNPEHERNLREVTLFFLELIAEKYSRFLIKKHGSAFLAQVFEAGFLVASEDPENWQGVEITDTPPAMAIQMMREYCIHSSNEHTWKIVYDLVNKYGTTGTTLQKAASIRILGYLSDSDALLDPVKENIGPITTFLISMFNSNEPIIREAAGEACGFFAENINPDFLDKHKQVMPVLLKQIHDCFGQEKSSHLDQSVQKMLMALNEFVQSLEYDICDYLEDIVKVLVMYIQDNTKFVRDTKYWALTALSTTILTSEKAIEPYSEGIFNIVGEIMHSSDEQNVKGNALMVAGRLIASCGKDKIKPEYVTTFTNFAALHLVGESKFELKETAITYFADLSVFLGDTDFAPYFDKVITEILKIMAEDNDLQDAEKTAKAGFSLDSDSEDGEGQQYADLAIMDEKSAALNALGVMGMHVPKLFDTKLKEVCEGLEQLQNHFHENVKYHVILSYMQIGFGMMKNAGVIDEDDKFNWTKGDLTNSQLPEKVQQYFDQIVFPYYFTILKQEDDKSVIERVLENFREMSIDFGPAIFQNNLDQILKFMKQLLQKKCFCQGNLDALEEDMGADAAEAGDFADDSDNENPEDESEDDEDDGINHDELILGGATDVILYLARAFGNSFVPHFEALQADLDLYCTEKNPKSDRMMIIGCVGEVFAACDASVAKYYTWFCALLAANAGTQDGKINRNIAYAIGILAEHAQLLFSQNLNDFVVQLQGITVGQTDQECLDNVVSAMARIVQFQYLTLPAEQRPADIGNTITNIMNSVPLQGDMTENENLLKFSWVLKDQYPDCFNANIEKIVEACLSCICQEKCAADITPKFKREIGQFLQSYVMTNHGAALTAMVAKLSQPQKDKLQKFMPTA